MTYRDMTFCKGDGCIHFDGCKRALTTAVSEAADRANRWISQFENPRELECWEGEDSLIDSVEPQ